MREKESRGAWDDPAANPQVRIADAVNSFLQVIAPRNGGKAKSTTRKIRALFLGPIPNGRTNPRGKLLRDCWSFAATRGSRCCRS